MRAMNPLVRRDERLDLAQRRWRAGAAAITVLTAAAVALGFPGTGSAGSHSIRVVLSGSSARASGDGAFSLPIFCRDEGTRCSLQVTVSTLPRRGHRSNRVIVASRTASLASNAIHRVKMMLTSRGLGLLVSAPSYKLSISVNIRATDVAGRATELRTTKSLFMAAAATRCWPHGSSTIIRTPGGRVYDYPAGQSGKTFSKALARSYGCLYGRGHPYALDDPIARHGRTRIDCGMGRFACSAITPPFLAYGIHPSGRPCGPPECAIPPTTIRIMNLESGRVVSNGPLVRDGQATPLNFPVAIAVSRMGLVAWTVEGESVSYVDALDHAEWRAVAAGPHIDPKFVRVVGHTIYWRDGGQLRSETLPPG